MSLLISTHFPPRGPSTSHANLPVFTLAARTSPSQSNQLLRFQREPSSPAASRTSTSSINTLPNTAAYPRKLNTSTIVSDTVALR